MSLIPEPDAAIESQSASKPEMPLADPADDELTEDVAGHLRDVLLTLARLENEPGYKFVALKFFRDRALVQEGFTWAVSDEARRAVLHEAISQRLMLTSRVPNPRDPQFPVTTIRLNRQMQQVCAVLGTNSTGERKFVPVSIRGEPLSTTVLRNRR